MVDSYYLCSHILQMYIIPLRVEFKYHGLVEAVLISIFRQTAQKNFLKGNYIHIQWDTSFPLQTSGPCADCVLHVHKLNRN